MRPSEGNIVRVRQSSMPPSRAGAGARNSRDENDQLRAGRTLQRCTVHKHRNLLAHAPERLHEEIGAADYTEGPYPPEQIVASRLHGEGYRKLWARCDLLAFAQAPAVCDG